MIIRRLEEQDLQQLPKLLQQLDRLHHQQAPEQYRSPEAMAKLRCEKSVFQRYLSGDITAYVAMDHHQLCGLVSGVTRLRESIIFKPVLIGHINEIVVSENCQGSGLAQQLLETLEQYFVQNGAEEIQLSVAEFNQKAVGFYSKNNYLTASRTLYKKTR